jgi:hypothetical protein
VWMKRVWRRYNDAVALYAEGGSQGEFLDGLPAQPLRWLVGDACLSLLAPLAPVVP